MKNYQVYIILLVGLLVRVLAAIFYPVEIFTDSVTYYDAAQNLINGEFISSDYVMPLYPLWIAFCVLFFDPLMGDVLISTMTIYVVMKLSFEIFHNEFAALISGFLLAVYPHAVFYSISGLSETFYVFLLTASLLLLYKKKYFYGCVFFVLSILTRPSLFFLGPFIVFFISYFVHQNSIKDTVRILFLYCLVYSFFISPWLIHNHLKYGDFVHLTLSKGVVMYTGNNPLNKSGGGVEGVDSDIRRFSSIKNPIERDQALMDSAVRYIIDKPGVFVRNSLNKFVRFWRVWPYAPQYQDILIKIISFVSYVPVLIASLLFVFTCSRDVLIRVFPIMMMIVYLTLIHMVTIGSIRYRFPLEPFLIIFFGTFFASNKLIREKLSSY